MRTRSIRLQGVSATTIEVTIYEWLYHTNQDPWKVRCLVLVVVLQPRSDLTMLLFRRLAPARVATSHVYNGTLGARYNGATPTSPETISLRCSVPTIVPKSWASWQTGFSEAEDAKVKELAAGGHSYESMAGFLLDRSELEIQRRYEELSGRDQARKYRRFTPAEDRVLVDMRKQDYQYSIIARKLNRSINGLRNRMKYLERKKLRKPPETSISDGTEMHRASGIANIATTVGNRAGMPYTAQDDAELLRMHKEGINVATIATRLGRSTRSVQERQQWVLRPGRQSSRTPLDLVNGGRGSAPRFSEAEKMTVVYHRRCLGWKWVNIARLLIGRKPRVIQVMYLRRWRDFYEDTSDEKLRQATSTAEDSVWQRSQSSPQIGPGFRAQRGFSTWCYNTAHSSVTTKGLSLSITRPVARVGHAELSRHPLLCQKLPRDGRLTRIRSCSSFWHPVCI